MTDYLIVGAGLAGIAFADIALQHNKSIHVFDNKSQNSSTIAGGLYNPVILKRFSEVWRSQEQVDLGNQFYAQLEEKLKVKLDNKIPIYRKLYSVEEQNNWFIASDKPNLAPFISPKISYNQYNGINSPFGFGEVLQSGYVDTAALLENYHAYLVESNLLQFDSFNYEDLIVNDDFVEYNNQHYKNVIFAEGFGIHANPYFCNLPLDGTKGELLIIKSNTLQLDVILKSSVFIIPLGNDLFKVGATYNWDDKTATPTEVGKNELLTDLRTLLTTEFEVVEHLAGVRPTVKDRRPMLGTHPKHSKLHVLNGLGTRGVMLAPDMAKMLFDYVEYQLPLDKQIDIIRFKKVRWD